MSLTVPVILGSVRRDRIGIRAARFLIAQLEARGHEAPLVDPAELKLPLLDRMYKEYPAGTAPNTLEQLAVLYRRSDAFVMVSAEYNHGVPPALSNTLDHFLEEYYWRPSAICCYSAGQFGGVRGRDAAAGDARGNGHAQHSLAPADPPAAGCHRGGRGAERAAARSLRGALPRRADMVRGSSRRTPPARNALLTRPRARQVRPRRQDAAASTAATADPFSLLQKGGCTTSRIMRP